MYTRLAFAVIVASLPLFARAQSVPIKSAPVAEGDQFLLFPSERAAMGGASIALDDRLLDPFINPAKTVNSSGLNFVTTPTYYGFLASGSAGEGSGRTLPVGAFMNDGSIFGGAMMAFQELVPAAESPDVVFRNSFGTREESAISQNNVYLFALAGSKIPGSDWSVGASVFHGRLRGLEGVRRMYRAGNVRQQGGMQQYRLGFYRHWQRGDAAEVVFMHHRFDMSHSFQEFTGGDQVIRREEHDETNGVALQAGYRWALENGWTLGGRINGDWKWHPKIPNYDLMQIPRDPGNSEAYNLGIGLARKRGGYTFGVDFIYEPIWSHTWANAAEVIQVGGSVVRPGEKTVDNHFQFNNARLRIGVQQEEDEVNFSIGLDVHLISYELDQMDFVRSRRRLLDQSWTEWTLSTGFGREFAGLRLHYMGRLTLGTGRPGIAAAGRDGASFNADWVVAPSGPLALQEALAFSHQLMLVVPLN